MSINFTAEEVIAHAKARYRKSICLDELADALVCRTIEDASNVLLMSSAMWDSPDGNPFDETNLIPEAELNPL